MEKPRDLGQRVTDLEHAFDAIIKNEEIIIKLGQRHKLDLQEVKVRAERIELDEGDARQRFDRIEQTQVTHGQRFDAIDDKLNRQGEVLEQILSLLQKGSQP